MKRILVPEAHTRAGLAVIRSLGRAGYEVHACSNQKEALGFFSRYANCKAVQPPYSHKKEYMDWLRRYICDKSIAMIVPSSNFLFGIEGNYAEFASLVPLMESEEALYRCFYKTYIAQTFAASANRSLAENQPDFTIFSDQTSSNATLPQETPYGYYIKAELPLDGSIAQSDKGELRFVADRKAVVSHVDELLQGWQNVLVQSGCTGRQVGVGLYIHEGEVLALSTVADCHLQPHSKGTMSLRRSIRHAGMEDDAISRLRALNWEGAAMVEYRWDERNDTFKLIEINFRFWQYLHLDLFAGVDFPLIQVRSKLEKYHISAPAPTVGVTCRDTFPGEVAQLVNQFRQSNGYWQKLTAIFQFLKVGFSPGVYSDLWFKGDIRVYFIGLARFIYSELSALSRRLFGSRQA